MTRSTRSAAFALLGALAGACAASGGAGPRGAHAPGSEAGGGAQLAARPSGGGSLEDLAHLITSAGQPRMVAGFVAERPEDLPELHTAGGDDGEALGSAAGGEPGDQARDPAGDPVAGSGELVPRAAEPPGAGVPPAARPAPQDPLDDEPSQNPYLEFGERILVHPDGRITKPFPISPQKGAKLLQLMLLYAPFPVKWARVAVDAEELLDAAGLGIAEVGPEDVEVILLEGWDLEFFENLREVPPSASPAAVPIADWFMVTARPKQLREVESFVNTFLTSVPQIEIEAKIIEIAEEDVLDYGVGSPGGVPVFDFPDGTLIDEFTYNLANSVAGQEAVLSLGAIQDETIFNLVLDAIATWENVTINSQPKIVVREGARADIVGTEEIPYFDIKGINPAGGFSAGVVFKPVGVQLYVIPRVLGTNTVSLQIDVESSQVTGSSITFTQTGTGLEKTEIAAPRIANRSARTVVHLEPGQAVILGGLTSEETQEKEEKVPLLGDIPILGNLFKNRFTRSRRVHVLFFIRPRILQGIEFQHAGVYGEDW